MAAAAAFYRDRLGFAVVHADDGFAIVRRDGAEVHLWCAGDDSWRDRPTAASPVESGAESFLAGTASCRIDVSAAIVLLLEEYRAQDVLHPRTRHLTSQPWGTVEFSALDLDGNLLTFVAEERR